MVNWAHPHQPRDKDWKKRNTPTHLEGPHLVILTTPMAIKVHHSQIKKAAAPEESNIWQAVCDPINLLKLRFQRMLQHHTFARESSGSATATFQKLLGQHTVED
jgi:hypothetical protein